MKDLRRLFQSPKTADRSHPSHHNVAKDKSSERKTKRAFKKIALQTTGALLKTSGNRFRNRVDTAAALVARELRTLERSRHWVPNSWRNPQQVDTSSASPAACSDNVSQSFVSGPTGLLAHSTPFKRLKSVTSRAYRLRPAPSTPQRNVHIVEGPEDCWLGRDVCHAVVKGEYVPPPMESLVAQMMSTMPEDYRTEQTKEREYVASTVDTRKMIGLPLGKPALQIIVDAPTIGELEVPQSLMKADNADITFEKTLVTPADSSQSSGTPAKSSFEKTVVHSEMTPFPSHDFVDDLWNFVDVEMAAVRDRIQVLECLVRQLNKHGIRTPNVAANDGLGEGNAQAKFESDTGSLGNLLARMNDRTSRLEVEHEWKRYMPDVTTTMDWKPSRTSKDMCCTSLFPPATVRPSNSRMSARLSKGHSSSGRVVDHGPDGHKGVSASEDSASVSTNPLEDQSTTSDSNDYRQTTMVTRARKAPLCRVREAWWCSNDGHNASDDSPSPTSNSSVSTSSSFSSECSSCLSPEEPFDGKSGNVRYVREEPRRHWLSPLYKRREGSEAAYGVSSPYMNRSFGGLEVEGVQF